VARPEAELRHRQRQDRRDRLPGRAEDSPRAASKAAKDGLAKLLIPTEEIFGRYSAYDLVNEATGEIYIEAGDELSPENLEKLDQAGIDRLELLDIDHTNTARGSGTP